MLSPSPTGPRRFLMQPGLVRAACWAVLLAGFLAFLISLDRYPQSYIDEPYFNGPAARYLHGKGLNYPVSLAAPDGDHVWAYHAPFFPRMQIATLSVFGINDFACRLPQFLAAYLAVALLCDFLVRRALFLPAILLAVVWIGDRSSQEALYGRMDGLALLCVTAGFIALVGALERPSWIRGLLCGMGLGMAVGFHPVTVPFGLVAAALLATCIKGPSRVRTLGAFMAGGLVPLGLILWAWSPDLRASFGQFRWAFGVAGALPLPHKLSHMLLALRWSVYWPIALVAAVALVLIPGVLVRRLAERRPFTSEDQGLAWLAACAFTVAGFCCLLTPTVFPYYLLYFTVWPVLALALTPSAGPRARAFRAWFLALSAAVAICWVPSLLWNGLRLRESLMYRAQLDHAHFIQDLRRTIPEGTNISGHPVFQLIMEEAHLDYTPVPWLPQQSPAAPGAWLLLTKEEWRHPQWIAPSSLEGRPVIVEADAFPGPGPFHLDYVILGPKAAPDEHAKPL